MSAPRAGDQLKERIRNQVELVPFIAGSIAVHGLVIAALGLWICPWLEQLTPTARAVVDIEVFEVGKKAAGGIKSESTADAIRAKPKPETKTDSHGVLKQADQAPLGAEGQALQAAAQPTASGPAVETIEISGGDGKPLVLSVAEYLKWVRTRNDPPIYPRLSRQRGEAGLVAVRVEINVAGKLILAEIETSSGFAMLDRVALDAVRSWAYPAFRSASATIRFSVRFKFGLD